MPGEIKIDDGSGNYTILTNGGSLGSDKTITIPNTTGTLALTSDSFGKVLQVVQASSTTIKTVASTTYSDSDLSASITPSSASNKVLVVISQNTQPQIVDNGIKSYMKIVRDTTDILTDSIVEILTGGATSNYLQTNQVLVYLDSPATTSSTTYKTQLKVNTTSNSGRVIAQNENSPSTITLIEIGA